MEARSLSAMASSPSCSSSSVLPRTLSLHAPQLSSLATPSLSFNPFIARRKQHSRARVVERNRTLVRARIMRDHDEDREDETAFSQEANASFLEILNSSQKEQTVMLRFVWLEKSIGLALDQVVPDYGTIPLTPYYFWPEKDAWEELKKNLEGKRWISRKRTITLLNEATDMINMWQQKAA